MKNLDPAEQLHIWAHSGGDRMESQHVGEMGMETPHHQSEELFTMDSFWERKKLCSLRMWFPGKQPCPSK